MSSSSQVQEIIDELEQQLKENCRNIVRGIRLTSKNGFITVNTSDQCQTLINTGLKIRNKPITLDNIWEKSTILQLSAVPPHVPDEQIIAAISRFADVIGRYLFACFFIFKMNFGIFQYLIRLYKDWKNVVFFSDKMITKYDVLNF